MARFVNRRELSLLSRQEHACNCGEDISWLISPDPWHTMLIKFSSYSGIANTLKTQVKSEIALILAGGRCRVNMSLP
jgi:hypothetical protein